MESSRQGMLVITMFSLSQGKQTAAYTVEQPKLHDLKLYYIILTALTVTEVPVSLNMRDIFCNLFPHAL